MQLSDNFTLAEMTFSMTAVRRGLDNTPTPEVVERLRALARNVLQPIRRAHGPVRILSGYRSPAVNRAVGGSTNSQHMRGEAADFIVPGKDNSFIAQWVVQNLTFDQLILEHYIPGVVNSGWVHVSYSTIRNRREVLTKVRNERGYRKGLVT